MALGLTIPARCPSPTTNSRRWRLLTCVAPCALALLAQLLLPAFQGLHLHTVGGAASCADVDHADEHAGDSERGGEHSERHHDPSKCTTCIALAALKRIAPVALVATVLPEAAPTTKRVLGYTPPAEPGYAPDMAVPRGPPHA